MSIGKRSIRYLSSSVVAAAISLVTLPLTTRILGPRDYGLFALALAVAGVGGSMVTPGSIFVVNRHWNVVDPDRRPEMVSTLIALGCGVAFAWGAMSFGLVLLLRDSVTFLREVPLDGLALTLISLVFSVFAFIAGEILTLEGRAGYYAWIGIAQALVTSAATLVALFVFDAGTLALFIGLFVGSLSGLAGSLPVVASLVRVRYDDRWRREATRSGWLASQAVGSVQPFVERVLLSRVAGFADLGLFTHSQRYGLIVHAAGKAVSRGAWPVSLAEARDPEGDFPATRRTWAAAHVGIAATGVAFTVLGDFLISALTNDKFTDAGVFLAPWFVLTMLQFSAKPEFATLYALSPSHVVARLGLATGLMGIVAGILLIPVFGTAGALAAVITQAAAYRALLRFVAWRYRPVPFQDGWALLGIGSLAVAFAGKLVVEDDLWASLALLVAVEAALFLAALRVIVVTARLLARSTRPA